MKLGVSNLAWDISVEDQAFQLLQDYSVDGVEVAPTRLAPWDQLDKPVLANYREKCARFGLVPSSLQAILFNQPNAQLLGTPDEFRFLCEHMRKIGRIASELGARIAVFGAPGNRKKGDTQDDLVMTIGLDRMSVLGKIARDYDLTIGIESVPEYYKCDFLTKIGNVAAFVKTLDDPHVKTHFDIACVTLGGDNPVEKIRELNGEFSHYHIAEPDLAGYEAPICDHQGAGRELALHHYDAWAVIEMKQLNGDGLGALKTALKYAKQNYLSI